MNIFLYSQVVLVELVQLDPKVTLDQPDLSARQVVLDLPDLPDQLEQQVQLDLLALLVELDQLAELV